MKKVLLSMLIIMMVMFCAAGAVQAQQQIVPQMEPAADEVLSAEGEPEDPDRIVVTISGAQVSASYNGASQTADGYEIVSVTGPEYNIEDIEFTGEASVSRTDIGITYMGLTGDMFRNTNEEVENISFVIIDGFIEVTPLSVDVLITGTTAHAVADGTSFTAEGFSATQVAPADALIYNTGDVRMRDGYRAQASGTEPGYYPMNLSEDFFENTNENFDVHFIVIDGSLEISEAPVVIEPVVEEPAVEEPTEEPVVEEPTEEPAVEEPTEEPVVEEPTEEPAVEEPTEEPVAEQPTGEPVVEEPTEEPAVEEPTEEPVAEQPTGEPVVEEPTEEPVVEEPTEEPAVEEPTEEPVAVEPTEEPAVEEPTEEPVVEEPTEEPVVEEPTEEPVEEPTDEPATEEPVKSPVILIPVILDPIEEPTEEPAVEESTEEPAADEPVVEEPTDEPAAEEPVSEEPEAGADEFEGSVSSDDRPAEETGEETVTEETAEEPAAESELLNLSAGTEIYDENGALRLTLDETLGMIVLSRDETKAAVYLEDSTVGYVYFNGDAAAEEEPAVTEIAAEEVITRLIPAETNIRLDADGMSEIIHTLDEAAELTVLETGAEWIKVALEDGTVGYIYRYDVEEPAVEENPEEVKPVTEKKVTIFTSLRSQMDEGEPVVLTSRLEGFEDCATVIYQWECDRGEGFAPVEGGDGDSYSFEATVESLRWSWRLTVFYK